MRLFIAIDIPEEIKNQIKEIKEQIKIDGKANFIDAEKIHLTLKFLGDVPDSQAEEIKQSLSKISFEPFEAITSELGVFPNENRIRVIWLGLKNHEHLKLLKQEIDKALPDFKDDHDFHAHLTIARVKFLNNKQELLEQIKKIKIQPKTFKITNFKLYKSTLTPEGPIYEELGVY